MGRRLALLAVAVGLVGCAREPPPVGVVFLSIDTLSARHTSLYGYERDTTPELRRLAGESLVFEHCWANAPWTVPSYMSQLTGLYASSFRRDVQPEDEDESAWFLAPAHRTLAEVLRARGYRTAAFVDSVHLSEHLGYAQGFEVFDTSAAGIPVEDREGGIREVTRRALDWLDELGPEEPFFLFLQAVDVHGPYVSEPRYREMYADAPPTGPDQRLPVAAGWRSIYGAVPRYIAGPFLAGRPEEDRATVRSRPIVDAYDGGVREVDAAIGDLARGLAERGVLDRAWFVLSADHGESLTEHEMYFSHMLLHGEELHVPLLLRPPGGLDGGRRLEPDVQLVDLAPTLLDLLGVPPAGRFHGRSLVPLLDGGELPPRPLVAHAGQFDSRAVLADGWKLVETRLRPARAPLTALLTAPPVRRWIERNLPAHRGEVLGTVAHPLEELRPEELERLARELLPELSEPRRRLFDVRVDPGEEVDRAAEEPERVQALLRLLDAEDARARAARVETAGSVPRAADDEARARLRALGYAGER